MSLGFSHDNNLFNCAAWIYPSGPADYQPVNFTITFDADNTRHLIPITLADDDIVEFNEVFSSILRLNTLETLVLLQPAETRVVVLDDDGKEVVGSRAGEAIEFVTLSILYL